MKTALPFEIVPDAEDENLYHTRCPHCGALDEIVEQDMGIRWNTLTNISPTGAIASTGDGDFDFDLWGCTGCGADAITEPEGWQIEEWY